MNSSIQSPQGDPDWLLTNYDPQLCERPDIEKEFQRLTVLKSFPQLSREKQSPIYNSFATEAMRLTNTRMSKITLVDLGCTRVIASAGDWPESLREMPRKTSFCAHTILSKQRVAMVGDASLDARFCDFPHVLETPKVRFYAGVPLISKEGCKVGSLSVLDSEDRPQGLAFEQSEALVELAHKLVAIMERDRETSPNVYVASALHAARDRHARQPSMVDFHSHEIAFDQLQLQSKVSEPMTLVNIRSFVQGLRYVMEVCPKQVDVVFSVDRRVPEMLSLNEFAVFRSAVTLLASACERTTMGVVRLRVAIEDASRLVVSCEDTSPNVGPETLGGNLFAPPSRPTVEALPECVAVDPITGDIVKSYLCRPYEDRSPEGMQLQTVAHYMKAVGGDYGFRRQQSHAVGSVFWFSVPVKTA